jgi:hypothetical protein
MTDVFLSYKREDEARVGRLVQALEKAGLKLWWDRGLPCGESWRANIQAALDVAKCVIVAWTRESTGPAGDFVRDEADQAKARGILVPVILEQGARPPLGFGEVQAIDLSHWRGSASDPFFRDLVVAVQAKLEGRAVPPARGPMARLMRRLTVGSIASATTAGLFAFALNFMSVQDHVCTVQLGQPFPSDACGALGLGNRPTHEERVAFEALPPGDCAALEAYRARFEESPLREIADSRLNARVTTREEQWIAGERRLALFAGGANESEARTRANTRAERLCRGFAASTQFRLDRSEATGEFSCEDGACGITGEAICHLQERQVVSRDTCGAGE